MKLSQPQAVSVQVGLAGLESMELIGLVELSPPSQIHGCRNRGQQPRRRVPITVPAALNFGNRFSPSAVVEVLLPRLSWGDSEEMALSVRAGVVAGVHQESVLLQVTAGLAARAS
jgi:hypothetical protein